MVSHFVRRETQDEQLALGATHLDDVDLVYSKTVIGPWGPALVAVAVKHGRHVCWQCGEGFIDEPRHKHRPEEIQMGFSRVLLHAGCVNPTRSVRKTFTNVLRGLHHRRELARAARASSSVAEAAETKKGGIIV